MKAVNTIAYVLVIIGALNWGLVGFFNFDLVATLLGEMSAVSRIVYGLVGISALVMIFTHKSGCKNCEVKSEAPAQAAPASEMPTE